MANLEHFHAAPNLYFQMDRANAIRLLKALVPEWIPVSRRQIVDSEESVEIGLEGNQFVSAVAYAGNEGWLVDAHQTGWSSLTNTGEVVTRR